MNLEDLKAEAAKLGYNLVKKQPYIKLSHCTCGKKKPAKWFIIQEENRENRDMIIYKCDSCGLSALPAKTDRQARKNWNQLVTN